jgi:multiple sugar transport system permease protein
MLCAPAVFVMLAVTAYPLGYAIWLSLQRYDLRVPGGTEFVGLQNYLTVFGSELWWRDFFTTVIITVVSVAIELVIGMGLALFMHRAIFGRRTVRTSILIPYGIITVVAAFAWQYASPPTSGSSTTGSTPSEHG